MTRPHSASALPRQPRLLPRLARALTLALAASVAASIASAPVAAAAEPTFQPAVVTATFGETIALAQAVTLPPGVTRIQVVIRAGEDSRSFLATVTNPGPGATTLRYSYATPLGSLFPNTPVELGFRLTFDDGRIVDGPTATVRYADDRFAWRTLQGALVRVHWYEGDAAFGQRALDIGERAVEEATSLLGVTETEPIDFFIYGGGEAFFDVIGPGIHENVGGFALANIRTLFANISPSAVRSPWVGIVVPHELTHLVFDTATRNPYHEPLHWLNEGLADYLAVGYDAGSRANVERAGRDDELMPLHALIGQFPSTAERFSLAYDESVSAIDYLVRTHGREALVTLIRSYADGVSDDAAFTAALGVDTATFEAGWLADLGFAAPAPYGPRPAPPGPLPPGWVAAPLATPGPGTSGPIATPGPGGPGDEDDLTGPILLVGIGVLALLIVAGILVVASRLSRGEPLLPSLAPSREPDPEPDEASEPDEGPDADAEPRS